MALKWLRRLLVPSQALVESLERRLGALERQEVEREAATAEAIEKLTRLYRKQRQRQVEDDKDQPEQVDSVTRAVLSARRLRGG